MAKPVIEFVKCPICCGHEVISREAIEILAKALQYEYPENSVELSNMRNAIRNFKQHADAANAAQEEDIEPKCPTPEKRRYALQEYTLTNAKNWKQHPYHCVCGYWHLSKHTASEHAAKINTLPSQPEEFDIIDPLLL